jgi:hypothetical protein
MQTFLAAVSEHGHLTREALLQAGHPIKVITAKSEKAARRGYTEYGVVSDRPWLTSKGRAYLQEHAECPHGDPTCPCQDGDVCHYVDDPATGTKAMQPPDGVAP